MNVPLSFSTVATRAVLTLRRRRRMSYLQSRRARLQNAQWLCTIVLASRIKIIFAPQAAEWSTISYLAFIHGVVADVHHRPRVRLGGSVWVSETEAGKKVALIRSDQINVHILRNGETWQKINTYLTFPKNQEIKRKRDANLQEVWLMRERAMGRVCVCMCVCAREGELVGGVVDRQGHMRVCERLKCVETASPWQQSARGRGGSRGLAWRASGCQASECVVWLRWLMASSLLMTRMQSETQRRIESRDRLGSAIAEWCRGGGCRRTDGFWNNIFGRPRGVCSVSGGQYETVLLGLRYGSNPTTDYS